MPPEYPAARTILPKKRFGEVDSLRAIACALVVIAHARVWPPWLNDFLMDRVEIGAIGVVMFFAISGFVIPDTLRGMRLEGVKRFFIRRFWRLYPPFWVAFLLTLWIKPQYGVGDWIWDAVMLPSLGSRGHSIAQFWTLEIELVFYLAIAGLFLIFGHLGKKVLLLGYLLLLGLAVRKVTASDAVVDYDTMLPYLVVMFWGGICREIRRFDFYRYRWLTPKLGVNWARSSALGVVSGMTMIVLLMSYSAVRGTGRSCELAGALGILGFLLWVILTPVRIDWLSRIGRWTYSTYLFHFVVIFIARPLFNIPDFEVTSLVPPYFTALCFLVSFALGALVYRWIEQPSDHVGKQLTTKL
ncbi:hypothetical protein AXK12_03930 [Cephaloticoccus capnophilus]|uniref:Acyltransferase 3 domain-containing protein n=1 Tax=Cephaloticoccus capnophilus TaxID=1548208 RepID=A0A139SNT9_9BACT|nr:acyltransferase [Cephaloticoccus capnophilus]KXU36172.1 hypothetical protein AXK12_03930 [Cephaloticoccus capnophilus]